jgi:hypothetical protein
MMGPQHDSYSPPSPMAMSSLAIFSRGVLKPKHLRGVVFSNHSISATARSL